MRERERGKEGKKEGTRVRERERRKERKERKMKEWCFYKEKRTFRARLVLLFFEGQKSEVFLLFFFPCSICCQSGKTPISFSRASFEASSVNEGDERTRRNVTACCSSSLSFFLSFFFLPLFLFLFPSPLPPSLTQATSEK